MYYHSVCCSLFEICMFKTMDNSHDAFCIVPASLFFTSLFDFFFEIIVVLSRPVIKLWNDDVTFRTTLTSFETISYICFFFEFIYFNICEQKRTDKTSSSQL